MKLLFYCDSGLFSPVEEKWSDLWPAMNGLVCLSLLLEGGVTVSNNFTKRRQNGLKLEQETK